MYSMFATLIMNSSEKKSCYVVSSIKTWLVFMLVRMFNLGSMARIGWYLKRGASQNFLFFQINIIW